MKLNLSLAVLVFMLLLISCRTNDKTNDGNVFNVSFDQCNDYLDLKLSDLIEDCRLIPLETTNESVLNQNPRILTVANYIIMEDRNGMYKFTHEGKYIKKLLTSGRGPFDLPRTFTYFVNERNNLIIINDRYRIEELLVYDYKSEKFLDPIKKSVPGWWGSFTIYKDSLILASLNPVMTDTTSYELFLQNFKGQLVSSIRKDKKMISPRNTEMVQRLQVANGTSDPYVYYIYEDTLFYYNPSQLTPYVIVSYNTPRTFIRGVIASEEESRVIFPAVDNNSFMFLIESVYKGMTPNQMGGTSANYTNNYFFLNKSKASFSRIKTYTDNILAKVQEGSGARMPRGSIIPTIIENNKLYVMYEASILKTIETNSELLREMPAGTSEQLQTVLKNLNEMDNPVLLIGTIKKNI